MILGLFLQQEKWAKTCAPKLGAFFLLFFLPSESSHFLSKLGQKKLLFFVCAHTAKTNTDVGYNSVHRLFDIMK